MLSNTVVLLQMARSSSRLIDKMGMPLYRSSITEKALPRRTWLTSLTRFTGDGIIDHPTEQSVPDSVSRLPTPLSMLTTGPSLYRANRTREPCLQWSYRALARHIATTTSPSHTHT